MDLLTPLNVLSVCEPCYFRVLPLHSQDFPLSCLAIVDTLLELVNVVHQLLLFEALNL